MNRQASKSVALERGLRPWSALLGGGLVGAAAALQPMTAWLAFALGGFVILAAAQLPAAVAILLTLRSAMDYLTETGFLLGPVRLNPAGTLGLAVLGVTAVYLLDRRLRRIEIDWGGAPAICFGILALFALIGTPVGFSAVGPKMLAVGLKETIRLSSLLALYLLIVNLSRDGLGSRTLLRCLYLSLIIPAAVGLWQFLYYTGEGYYSLAIGAVPRGRLNGTFYHPTSFGVYLAFLMTLSVSLLRSVRFGIPRWALISVLGLGGFLLVFTFSRGAWAFLLVALAVKFLLKPGKALILLIALGLVLAAAFGPRIAARFSDLGTDISLQRVVGRQDLNNSFEWRMYNWFILLNVGTERPLLGHGTGSTTYVNPLKSVDEEDQTSKGFGAHNEFVRFFVEGGAVGVALLSLFFLLFLRWAWRIFKVLRERGDPRADLAGVGLEVLAGLLLMSLATGNPLDKTSVFYYFIICFALLRRAECETR